MNATDRYLKFVQWYEEVQRIDRVFELSSSLFSVE